MKEIWKQINDFRTIADAEGFWLAPDPGSCLLEAVIELGEVVDAWFRLDRADEMRVGDRKRDFHGELADLMIVLLSAISEPGTDSGLQLLTKPEHAINQICRIVGSLPVKHADRNVVTIWRGPYIEEQIDHVFRIITGTFGPDMPYKDFRNVINSQLVEHIPRNSSKRYELISQYPVLGQMLASSVKAHL